MTESSPTSVLERKSQRRVQIPGTFPLKTKEGSMYKFTVTERKRADEKRNVSFAIFARISVVRGFVCMIVGGNERFVPRPLGLELGLWCVLSVAMGGVRS